MSDNLDYKIILEEILAEIRPYTRRGKVAAYIPELGKISPDKLGLRFAPRGEIPITLATHLSDFRSKVCGIDYRDLGTVDYEQ